jgi:hypothetical protein
VNDKRRPPAPPANNHSPGRDSSATGGEKALARRRPRLVITVPLEGPAQILLDADTLEDETRLRVWLRRSSALATLPGVLHRLLDDLDDDRLAA